MTTKEQWLEAASTCESQIEWWKVSPTREAHPRYVDKQIENLQLLVRLCRALGEGTHVLVPKELPPEWLEIGRKAIEDYLVVLRDDRISMPNRGNGLVIRERDGRVSHIIRMGPENALTIGLNAMLAAAPEVP